ncbi:hypothetical protein EBL89_12150 [Cereibacter sphaeroides]|uniref:hypothetical protein n=1 Tax=Cereibacter sphaeroides TaxID=1063 RepID=UPI000F526B1A|nr:hypothetical protein [Cereibacter sphaeroides]AZB56040.1 hypothetical protein EBL89_12150 [Cereibacter sphaeroides]AZB60303.1 hypothetical protein EBL88_12100 [Cereibacter sphaeroides]
MPDNHDVRPVFVRCFVSNPGGAYDPAPLHDLDHKCFSPPMVGDMIRVAWHPNPKVYRVTQRVFGVGTADDLSTLALLVQEVDPSEVPEV